MFPAIVYKKYMFLPVDFFFTTESYAELMDTQTWKYTLKLGGIAWCAAASWDFCGFRGVRSYGNFLCKEGSIMGKLQKRKGTWERTTWKGKRRFSLFALRMPYYLCSNYRRKSLDAGDELKKKTEKLRGTSDHQCSISYNAGHKRRIPSFRWLEYYI